MRIAHVKVLVCMACCMAFAFAQNPPKESRMRIGVLNLTVTGGDADFGAKSSELLVSLVNDVGFYDVHDQGAMEKEYAKLDKKFPRSCRDPRCVLSIGAALKFERVIYGTLDKGNNTYGIVLTMLDCFSKLTLEQVNLESEPGVELKDFLKAVVAKLHGQKDADVNMKMKKYFGPEVHNETGMYITGGATIGLGLVWALVNGSLYGKDYGAVRLEHDYSTLASDEKNLSGIATSIQDIAVFARPAGLGDAYIAASEDAYGPLYNPAGMASVPGQEAAVAYQYRFGLPLFAASYVNKATREIGFGSAFEYYGDSLAYDALFISSFAYKFNDLFSFFRPISVGASVKVRTSKMQGTSESSIEAGSFGFGLDLGLKCDLSDIIQFAAVLRDCPSTGHWNNSSTDTGYFESQPPRLILGGSFQASHLTYLIAEGDIPLYADQPWKMAGGIEQELFRFLKIRLGAKKTIMSEEFEPSWIITPGLGIYLTFDNAPVKSVVFDAAYEWNQNEPFSNVLNFSFKLGF